MGEFWVRREVCFRLGSCGGRVEMGQLGKLWFEGEVVPICAFDIKSQY